MFRTISLLIWTFFVEKSFGIPSTDLCKVSKRYQTSCNPLQLYYLVTHTVRLVMKNVHLRTHLKLLTKVPWSGPPWHQYTITYCAQIKFSRAQLTCINLKLVSPKKLQKIPKQFLTYFSVKNIRFALVSR